MTEICYNVVYRGRVLEGFDVEAAKRKLIEKFALSEEKALRILKSRRAVLKKTADEAVARRLGSALKKAGLDVALTMNPPPAGQVQTARPSSPQEAAPLAASAAAGEGASAAAAVPEGASPAPVARIAFEFRGSGVEYFRIWLVNCILSIVTLGIYSAWAKVRRKQYFYGNTRLNGSSFEYLADPVKILKGRAIAAGIFILYSVVSNLVPIAGLFVSLAFMLLLPWLVVRSLAFNARNSALRNIRFGFDAPLMDAAKVYVLWPLLAALTLGVLFPYVLYRQKKFVVENSSYGRTRFTFNAGPADYYRIFLLALVPLLVGILAVLAAGFFLMPLAIVAGLVLYLYLFAFFSVKSTNLLYNATALAGHRFEADLAMAPYLALLTTNSLGTALTLGLFHPWAKVRILRYKLAHLALAVNGDLDGFIAAEQAQVSAVGGEVSDMFDFDFGL